MDRIPGYGPSPGPGDARGAVTLRAGLLVLGVLLLHLAFIASYLGALHDPRPDRVPIAVAAPGDRRAEVVRGLEELPGHPLEAERTASDAAAARRLVERREVDGAYVVDAEGRSDTLYVASGGGTALAEAVRETVTRAAEAEGREVEVRDVAPAAGGDSRGLSAFYLIIGWCVGGYLVAAALAVSAGARPATVRRAARRLLVLAGYAVAAGLAGAVIAGPVLGALPGRVLALAGTGALVVFATGALTLALQGLFGMFGIGLALLLVVVLGNPSAGGPYAYPLLPAFWQAIGPVLIPGAGTWTARSVAYFEGHAVLGPLLVLAAWAVAGTALTLLLARFRSAPRSSLDELSFV
ncbi:DUF3533 domain-containing protein [Streptomyces sp. DSM 44917]|uniref:DUF3533 domain-containing protein n=1 Tax=Streptomyces boetiae TaxID=3075541 RepID=A0ABU2L2G3_9ACTN|nr:DUF3533 domain-containing protein [Streptomyces sp. DSM 44917]MDT0305750.1 DUF3533 domain-containing protein [Streptomyces sp. DSM 44917]